jgi:alkylhydroperoxidase/carboxymuconolactone decarboxylase family protein YurZ
MTSEAAREGHRTRTEVLGEDYVAKSAAALTEFRRPLLELVTEYGWGSVWTRPGLDRRSRSLVTIAAMAALGHQGELAVHVRGAVRAGVSATEIQEVLLQMGVYCGVPTAAEALATAEAVIEELGAGQQAVTGTTYDDRGGTPTTIRTKVVLLLAAGTDAPRDALRDALAQGAREVQEALPPGHTSRAGIGVDPAAAREALAALGSDGRDDFGAPGYQGMIWATGPGGSMDVLVDAVRGIAGRLGDLVDPTASAAVAGTEEVFLPGDGPLLGLYGIRRRPGDSAEHFHDFWRLEHTKLSMHIPGFRYRQLHAVGYASEQAARSAGVGVHDIDGCVEYFFDDLQYQVDMTRLDNFPEIYQDEKNFIDHDRATFTYVELLD